MEKKQNSQKQNKPETEKVCPFYGKLACKDCRLFIEIPGYPGQRQCALILAAIK